MMSLAHSIRRPASETLRPLYEIAESLDQILFMVAGDLSSVFYVSPAYERITGYSCESLYENPQAWIESICQEDSPFVREMIRKRLSGELQGQSKMEYRIQRADGRVRWLRGNITPVSDDTGQVVRLIGLAEDITAEKLDEVASREMQADLARNVDRRNDELSQTVTQLEQEIVRRKQIEVELRRSESRFRRLFEVNIIGVVFCDIYGNISDANEAFLEMTGYSRADLPFRWDTMTPPEFAHMDQMAVGQLIEKGSATPWEKEYLRKDGKRVSVVIGVALLEHDTWQCVAFVVDRTQHNDAEERVRQVNLQLEHAARLSVLGEMVADLAHEIHQPLGVIANYADGSLRRLSQGELTIGATKMCLEEIAAESIRVAEVLRRVREFIQMREPERKPVDLNEIIIESLQFTRLERREHGVTIFFRSDPHLPPVQADRAQITQVLVNLLVNAIQAVAKANQPCPKILVSTHVNEGGFAEISVADNGPGISPTDLPRIFDRFFTTKPEGLGLGLPISRSIIESHGGQLWCDPTPGESTAFRLTLPADKASREE
jgi:PAS domain S-box-containing protein